MAAEDAVLTEPASVVYRGLTRAGVGPGSRVLVIGDGTIALLAVYLLQLWSPAEVVLLGRREAQAELAARAGAARFEVSPDAAGDGYDLVIEAAGAVEAAAVAFTAARRGGTVLLLGLPPHGQTAALGVDDVVNNDLAILGSFSYTSAAWRDVVRLLNAGLISPGFLVTHRFALADLEQAIACLRGTGRPGATGRAARYCWRSARPDHDEATHASQPARAPDVSNQPGQPTSVTTDGRGTTDDLHQREPARPG